MSNLSYYLGIYQRDAESILTNNVVLKEQK